MSVELWKSYVVRLPSLRDSASFGTQNLSLSWQKMWIVPNWKILGIFYFLFFFCVCLLFFCLGGPLKYSLEGHRFAIFGSSLTHDKRYVVSISNRFISWDINTSEVCRDIDPRADGMILGLAITVDDRYAAAFTTNNQLIIIDIMLGHYLKVEHVSLDNFITVDIPEFSYNDTSH